MGATVTMDMERAKELEPIKKQKYEADAKAALAHTKVKAGKQIYQVVNITIIQGTYHCCLSCFEVA